MWTFTHFITLIPSLIVYVFIALGVGKWLRNKDEKIRLIPIHIITGLIIVLEIIKQVRSVVIGYDLADLPFYYCSLFLYLYPVVSLYQGKHKDTFRMLTFLSGFTMFAVLMVMPDMIYVEGNIIDFFINFDNFHTVVFHNLVVLGTMLLLTLQLIKIDFKRDLIAGIIFYSAYCVIAAPIAILLGQNYNKFNTNPVAFVENIRLALINSFGYHIGQSGYVLLALITTVGFSLIMYLFFVMIVKLVKNTQHKKNNN